MIALQKLLIHAGTVIKTLQVRLGGELDEVAVTGLVLGQQNEVVVALVAGAAAEAAVRRQIDLAANNGLYARFPGGEVELDGAVHNPVVGYGQAFHAHFLGSLHELGDATHAVEQAVLGMNMEVAEHGSDLL
ncbi:hypothetical protein ES703_84034 [subsurface metagenome]